MMADIATSSLDEFVHLAYFLQPFYVGSRRALFDLAKQVDRFRLIARFAWVVCRDDHAHIHGDHKAALANQPRPLDAFSLDLHDWNSSSRKCTVTSLATSFSFNQDQTAVHGMPSGRNSS